VATSIQRPSSTASGPPSDGADLIIVGQERGYRCLLADNVLIDETASVASPTRDPNSSTEISSPNGQGVGGTPLVPVQPASEIHGKAVLPVAGVERRPGELDPADRWHSSTGS